MPIFGRKEERGVIPSGWLEKRSIDKELSDVFKWDKRKLKSEMERYTEKLGKAEKTIEECASEISDIEKEISDRRLKIAARMKEPNWEQSITIGLAEKEIGVLDNNANAKADDSLQAMADRKAFQETLDLIESVTSERVKSAEELITASKPPRRGAIEKKWPTMRSRSERDNTDITSRLGLGGATGNSDESE